MKKYLDYLPRDKHDFERVNELKKWDRSELVPLLPNLLEWIQDINWPIAHEVAELLLTVPKDIIPLIQRVLETTDEIWKYWCLEVLVKRLSDEDKKSLQEDLLRLAESPTTAEKYEEVDELAKEILQSMK